MASVKPSKAFKGSKSKAKLTPSKSDKAKVQPGKAKLKQKAPINSKFIKGMKKEQGGT